jgi:protease-4
MSLDTDAIVDRRRLRRSLAFWRIGAILLVGVLIAAGGLYWVDDGLTPRTRPHVARVTVSGVILDNRPRIELLEELEKSNASAVMLVIDSPGGGVAASERLYNAVRRLSEKKPTVAVFGSLAASGGYLTALGAERIFAPETALTGSIGVLIQYPNFAGLLDKIGVDVEAVKSSPLKASPNGFEPTSPEARAALQSVVTDTYDWFKGIVAERRHLGGEQLATVTDGRIFTGRQALGLKLVDAIGGEEAARGWLASEKGVSRDLPVRDWRPKRSGLGGLPFVDAAVAAVLRSLGLGAVAERIAAGEGLPGTGHLGLDGLLAVWHPALEK